MAEILLIPGTVERKDNSARSFQGAGWNRDVELESQVVCCWGGPICDNSTVIVQPIDPVVPSRVRGLMSPGL